MYVAPKEAHHDLGRTLNHMLLRLAPEHVSGGPAPSCSRLCLGEWWKIERKRKRRRRKRMRE
jgi:hypothetical protein